MKGPDMASGPSTRLEHGHIVAAFHQLVSARKTGDPGADNDDSLLCARALGVQRSQTGHRRSTHSQNIAPLHCLPLSLLLNLWRSSLRGHWFAARRQALLKGFHNVHRRRRFWGGLLGRYFLTLQLRRDDLAEFFPKRVFEL